MVIPHPRFAQFAARCFELERVAAKPCAHACFRFAELKFAHSKDLLSGNGAKKSGGRINGIGAFPVIYASADPLTATMEAYQNFSAFGFARRNVLPKVLIGIDIKLAAVLDLCDRRIRQRLKVTLKDLTQPWWPVQEAGGEALTQAIGRAAYSAGFEAVMLPSARRKNGVNLNVFPEKLRIGSSVTVMGEQDLQKRLR